ncbi:cache domain-containing sensor histidine kinase [Paenibacillus sp. sgz302251]|uniref:cache domain-containing sensor histidine kinase n=1 Tax=Paenibacillus sp. sgz302251 TaxID=3414493 RepID=UPI003C7BBC22
MKKIRVKIVLSMLTVACIPLGILAGILLYQVSQQIEGDLNHVRERMEQDVKEKIEQYHQDFYETAYRIYSNTALLESLANDTNYEPDDSRTYDTVRDMNAFFLNIYNYRVKDIVGLYLVNSHQQTVGYFIPELSKLGNRHDDYIHQVGSYVQVPIGQRSKTRFVQSRYYGEPVIQYIFPVNFRGDQVGTLVIDVKESNFHMMIERYNTFYAGQIVITDESNVIQYHTDSEKRELKLDRSHGSNDRIFIETPIPVADWKLIYIYKINPHLLLIRNLAFSLVGLSFLLAVGFSLYLGYSITKPIIHLHRKMHQIQIGDYSARASIGSKDEIGFLSNQFNRMAGEIQQLIENDLRLQLLNKETHIRALQAQISPHFLYNTLQTITSIAMVNHVPEIKLICQSLGNMYRYNMNISNESVPLQDEAMHVRNYLTIINKRYPQQIRIRIQFDQSTKDCLVPKLILQPLVENAVEHGLIPARRNRKLIKISAKKDTINGILNISVLDNGNGIQQEVLEELNRNLQHAATRKEPGLNNGYSIGIGNVHMRIQLLYGTEYGIVLYSKAGKGTCVMIRLPLYQE